jgi:hypothetical protein
MSNTLTVPCSQSSPVHKLTRELFETAGVPVAPRVDPTPSTPAAAAVLSNTRSPQEWERVIRGAWQKEVARIVEVGRLLTQARAQLSPEAFKALRLPFGERMRRMLISIAANPIIADPRNHGSVPASWRTLYELTKISHHDLLAAIKSSIVHPDMERKEVAALRSIQCDSRASSSLPGQTTAPIALESTTADQLRAHLDKLGRAGVCAVMSPELLVEIAEHALGQEIRISDPSSDLAGLLTRILRHGLASTVEADRAQIAERIAAKLKTNGFDHHAVVIAFTKAAAPKARASNKRKSGKRRSPPTL